MPISPIVKSPRTSLEGFRSLYSLLHSLTRPSNTAVNIHALTRRTRTRTLPRSHTHIHNGKHSHRCAVTRSPPATCSLTPHLRVLAGSDRGHCEHESLRFGRPSHACVSCPNPRGVLHVHGRGWFHAPGLRGRHRCGKRALCTRGRGWVCRRVSSCLSGAPYFLPLTLCLFFALTHMPRCGSSSCSGRGYRHPRPGRPAWLGRRPVNVGDSEYGAVRPPCWLPSCRCVLPLEHSAHFV